MRGIDVRQSGGAVLVRLGLDDNSGNALGTGAATLRVLEWQSDGTLKQLDFADNTLKTSALTTPTAAMTARAAPDATVSGLWAYLLSSGNTANFTAGNVYVTLVTHSTIPGVVFRREWQYGAAEGDLSVNTAGNVAADLLTIKSQAVTCSAGVTVLASVGTATTSTAQTGDAYAAVMALPSFFIPATVSTATSATSFVVAFTGTQSAAGLAGLFCSFTTAGRSPEKLAIATATSVDSTHVTLTFANNGFGVAPQLDDAVQIG